MPLEAVEARRLYRQVADQLRALIDSGEYRVGSRLPTERDLAEQLKVSRPTVREALMVHDRAFHVAVAGCLGNAVLTRVVGELFDQRLNPYFAKLANYFENPESWRTAHAEHEEIRRAIAARDSDRAQVAMRDHLARSQGRFAQSFGTETAGSRVRSRSG